MVRKPRFDSSVGYNGDIARTLKPNKMYTLTVNQQRTVDFNTATDVLNEAQRVIGTAIVMAEFGRKLMAIFKNGNRIV